MHFGAGEVQVLEHDWVPIVVALIGLIGVLTPGFLQQRSTRKKLSEHLSALRTENTQQHHEGQEKIIGHLLVLHEGQERIEKKVDKNTDRLDALDRRDAVEGL